MPRKQTQEGEGMTRPQTQNSPSPSRVSRFQSLTSESDMTEFNASNLQELQDCCDDCWQKCKDNGLTDEADQCEELKAQCRSANQALATKSMASVDWFSFALAAMKMLSDILSKLNTKEQSA